MPYNFKKTAAFPRGPLAEYAKAGYGNPLNPLAASTPAPLQLQGPLAGFTEPRINHPLNPSTMPMAQPMPAVAPTAPTFKDRWAEFTKGGFNSDAFNLGTSLLSNSGYTSTPVTLGQALGQGGQAIQQGRERSRANEMREWEYQQAQQQAAQQEQQRQAQAQQMQAQEDYINTLPPDQQALARASGGSYIKEAAKSKFAKPSKRKIVKGADGYQYYADTGERALPGVTAKAKSPLATITTSNGDTIQVGGDGAYPGAPQNAKPTTNAIEKMSLNTGEALARLKRIGDRFKPEYQEWAFRSEDLWNRTKDKLGMSVSAEDAATMTDFSAYRREGLENINRYIKEITGAQMSEAEANRLKLAVPDPGAGVFNGDSPIQFKSKYDSAVDAAEAASLRYQYLMQRGTLAQGTQFSAGIARQYPLEVFIQAQTAISGGADPEKVYLHLNKKYGSK